MITIHNAAAAAAAADDDDDDVSCFIPSYYIARLTCFDMGLILISLKNIILDWWTDWFTIFCVSSKIVVYNM